MLKDSMLFLARQDSIRHFVSSNSAARRVARRFVAGETLREALLVARTLNRQHISVSLDHLGENVCVAAEAEAATRDYIETLDQIQTEWGGGQHFRKAHRAWAGYRGRALPEECDIRAPSCQ